MFQSQMGSLGFYVDYLYMYNSFNYACMSVKQYMWERKVGCNFDFETINVQPFNKGWHQVLLPAWDGLWYLLILKSVV
jgi:hypothetical protein